MDQLPIRPADPHTLSCSPVPRIRPQAGAPGRQVARFILCMQLSLRCPELSDKARSTVNQIVEFTFPRGRRGN